MKNLKKHYCTYMQPSGRVVLRGMFIHQTNLPEKDKTYH